MEKEIENISRFHYLKKISKFLKIDWEEALEKMVLCNYEKNRWYRTQKADYNSDWFCFQAVNDFFDFTLQGLKALAGDDISQKIKTAIDVGAGVGLSTIYIKKNTKIDISYNNIKGKQIDIFRHISSNEDIKIIDKDVFKIDEKVDALICFEFFEHFANPTSVFFSLASKTDAKYIIMQNSFGAFGYGHYNEYQFSNGVFDKNVAKENFLKYIKSIGFKLRKIKDSRVVIAERISKEDKNE